MIDDDWWRLMMIDDDMGMDHVTYEFTMLGAIFASRKNQLF